MVKVPETKPVKLRETEHSISNPNFFDRFRINYFLESLGDPRNESEIAKLLDKMVVEELLGQTSTNSYWRVAQLNAYGATFPSIDAEALHPDQLQFLHKNKDQIHILDGKDVVPSKWHVYLRKLT